ncbi:MAG: sigma 54-interacting transcriptional regulator, partial [Bacillota bacterium]|nr:sigma 54-interacting transcriptional regulator [Bacillota bacterium]
KLMKVIETGKEEISAEFEYNKRKYLVDRIPIKKENSIEGAIAIFHDITSIMKFSEKILEDEVYINTLNEINNVFNERIVVVDKNGIITMMSNSYKEFLKETNPEGRHITDIIENTRLHIVAKTGEDEIGEIQIINGHKAIAMRMAIKKDGKTIGAIGKILFRDISELVALSKKTSNLEKELRRLKSELNEEHIFKYSFDSLVGSSTAIETVKKLAMKVSKTDSNVLINGESGTGKELFVHAIHNASNRRYKPFVKINCAAIPKELIESELFGYEEGAFTGARKGGKKGKFEVAEKGTLLLDEIGDMPLLMQSKLLRVLQEKEYEKIGSNEVKKTDVRIIASTNKDLKKLVKQKLFREDLYYRLNVMSIELPSLRERKEDIEILTYDLINQIGNRLNIYVEGITEEALNYFKVYDWPGNIRELENVIERAINLLGSKFIIEEKHLPLFLTKNKSNKYIRTEMNLKKMIEELEKETIRKCLEETGGNKNQSSKILNISRMS